MTPRFTVAVLLFGLLFSGAVRRQPDLKEHHSKRCNEILGIFTDGNMSAYEIASRMTWDIKGDSWEAFPLAQKWFATGEGQSLT